jgi:signal transduction histidine kinase
MNTVPIHIKLLIIENNESEYCITHNYIQKIKGYEFQTLWAKDHAEGIDKILHEQPDICLLDFLSSTNTGIIFLKEVRKRNYDIPIILLTGDGNVKIDREAMALGATDYLIKNELNTEKIERSIRYTLSHIKALRSEQDRIIVEKMAATSRFTRVLAHEVRNPLNNIDLSVKQLELEYPDAEWLDYLHIIKRNSKRIGTLITELLHNSTPLNLDFSIHVLHDLLDETVHLAEDKLILKNITLIKNYTHDNPSVLVAAEAIKLAILNIIVNAIEAVYAENASITITTQLQNEECTISIEDNGCGIPADHLNRIFEPYVTTKPNGTGLGLITALNVIKGHKGAIRVTSTVDVGTRFLVSFPCLR